MKRNKKILAFLLSLALTLSLAACGGDSGSSGDSGSTGTSSAGEEGSVPGVKKDLIVGTAADINQLNPMLQNDQANNNCLVMTHQRLVSLDNETNEKNPQLATSWEWTDDNHLVFHLVENATFSTGEPLTADDVVFTYEMAMSDDPTPVSYTHLDVYKRQLPNTMDGDDTAEVECVMTQSEIRKLTDELDALCTKYPDRA